MVACRSIAEATQRLACYDSKVAQIDAAEKAGDLVVADKKMMQDTRRGLFGFRLPDFGVFGKKGDEASRGLDDIEEISTTLASARQMRDGNWKLVLQDGAVWEQTDSYRLIEDPRSGSPIIIKQGVLGNYKARIDGQPAIKVRRVE